MINVLLVDDQFDRLIKKSRILRQLGCHIEAYSNPENALVMLHVKTHFDLIFVTLDMVPIHGIDFAAAVREGYPDARIILTASTYPSQSTQDRIKTLKIKTCIFADPTAERYHLAITSMLARES